MPARTSLGRDEWVDAAYSRFVTDGLAAIKVETLAKSLGATKGSFYWHFENRIALIHAVMERWEREETDRIIEIADVGGTARERLEGLFAEVAARSTQPSGERTLYVEAEPEGVSDVITRVTDRRIGYIANLLTELGFDPDEARRRGTIATAVVVGMQQLGADLGAMPSRELTDTALRMTLSP